MVSDIYWVFPKQGMTDFMDLFHHNAHRPVRIQTNYCATRIIFIINDFGVVTYREKIRLLKRFFWNNILWFSCLRPGCEARQHVMWFCHMFVWITASIRHISGVLGSKILGLLYTNFNISMDNWVIHSCVVMSLLLSSKSAHSKQYRGLKSE